jgi:hypothetical protein
MAKYKNREKFSDANTSHETTPKWHGFLMINLVALAAGGRAEKRTAFLEFLFRFNWSFRRPAAGQIPNT